MNYNLFTNGVYNRVVKNPLILPIDPNFQRNIQVTPSNPKTTHQTSMLFSTPGSSPRPKKSTTSPSRSRTVLEAIFSVVMGDSETGETMSGTQNDASPLGRWYMGVSKNRGKNPQKWMVKIMENPY